MSAVTMTLESVANVASPSVLFTNVTSAERTCIHGVEGLWAKKVMDNLYVVRNVILNLYLYKVNYIVYTLCYH